MKRIGEVVRTAGGVAVARSPDDSTPSIGDAVVDESLSEVGRIVDVMGPVGRPYVVVAADAAPAALLNRPLYVR